MTSGDASVSDWIEVVDPVLDTEGSQCDFHGDRKDPGLPGPVRRQPYGTEAWKDAATYCNNDLVNALTKALTALSVEKTIFSNEKALDLQPVHVGSPDGCRVR